REEAGAFVAEALVERRWRQARGVGPRGARGHTPALASRQREGAQPAALRRRPGQVQHAAASPQVRPHRLVERRRDDDRRLAPGPARVEAEPLEPLAEESIEAEDPEPSAADPRPR